MGFTHMRALSRSLLAAGITVGLLGAGAATASAAPRDRSASDSPAKTDYIAGYYTTSPTGHAVTGTYTVPKVNCSSVADPEELQPIVAVSANGGVDGAAVTIYCTDRVQSSYVTLENDSGSYTQPFAVSPGNLIYLSAVAVPRAAPGAQFVMSARDLTTGQKATMTGGTDTDVTYTGLYFQTFTGTGTGVPEFSPVAVLGATIDGAPINSRNVSAENEYDGNYLSISVSPILLSSFLFTWNHS
jgi:hypothetical protein